MNREDEETGHTASFVVRVWWDETGDRPVWRGWIQHAASGHSRYFHTGEEAARFVEHHTCSRRDNQRASECLNSRTDTESTEFSG